MFQFHLFLYIYCLVWGYIFIIIDYVFPNSLNGHIPHSIHTKYREVQTFVFQFHSFPSCFGREIGIYKLLLIIHCRFLLNMPTTFPNTQLILKSTAAFRFQFHSFRNNFRRKNIIFHNFGETFLFKLKSPLKVHYKYWSE